MLWSEAVQDFRSLSVWAKAHQLTLAVYEAAAGFPRDELYGLKRQIRRACASIPANIAEGCGRDSHADFARFLQFAMGSASETEYFLLLAADLGMLERNDHRHLAKGVEEVKRMLASLITRVRAQADAPEPRTEN